jgi:hypothetical protein
MALISCPECDKLISAKALACPSCGHPVESASSPNYNSDTVVDSNTIAYDRDKNIIKHNNENLGIVLVAIPLAASFLLYCVANYAVYGSFFYKSLGIYVATVLSTAYVAYLESNRYSSSTPTEHLVGFMLLWPIAYPYYLYCRRLYCLKNLSVLGVIVAIIFVCCLYNVYYQYNDAQEYFNQFRRY